MTKKLSQTSQYNCVLLPRIILFHLLWFNGFFFSFLYGFVCCYWKRFSLFKIYMSTGTLSAILQHIYFTDWNNISVIGVFVCIDSMVCEQVLYMYSMSVHCSMVRCMNVIWSIYMRIIFDMMRKRVKWNEYRTQKHVKQIC